MDDLTVRNVTIPSHELEWRFSRSGGPGGQHANTSDTAAELRWYPADSEALRGAARDRVLQRLGDRLTADGALIVRAAEHRSQHRNRAEALRRLADLVDGALRPPARARRPTRPSRAAQRRRVEDKRRRGELKRLRQRPDLR